MNLSIKDVNKIVEESLKAFKETLKTELGDNPPSLSAQTGGNVPAANSDEVAALRRDLEDLKASLKSRQVGGGFVEKVYDLKKQFYTFVANLDVKVDWVQTVATDPEILNQAFKGVLEQVKLEGGNDQCKLFPWEKHMAIIDKDLTLKQWINAPTGIFDTDNFKNFDAKGKFVSWSSGFPKSNVFDTSNPQYLDNFLHNYDSIENPNNPKKWERKPAKSARVDLGTGTGKSTFFLVCLAFRQYSMAFLKKNKELFEKLQSELKIGASLVVPYKSLVPALMDSHLYSNWLNNPNSKDRRVIECQICYDKDNPDKGNHTGYTMVHNAPADLVNIFSFKEAEEAFDQKKVDKNNMPLLKDPIVLDEAHMDSATYQKWIKIFKEKIYKPWNYKDVMMPGYKGRWFNIVEMSATFRDLPRSRKLSGSIIDYAFGNFNRLVEATKSKFFKAPVLVYCDKPTTPIEDEKGNKSKFPAVNFTTLRKAGIKFKDLTRPGFKDYAKKLLQYLKPPYLAFLNEDYETGISFGIPILNCISTGRALRKVINNKWKIVDVPGIVTDGNALQQRGRLSRVKEFPTNIWGAMFEAFGNFTGKLKWTDNAGKKQEDAAATAIEKYYMTTDRQPQTIADYNKALKSLDDEFTPELTDEEKKQRAQEDKENFEIILVGELTQALADPAKLLKKPTSDEKKKQQKTSDGKVVEVGRDLGEFTFASPLVKHLDPKRLSGLIEIATRPLIRQLAKGGAFPWYKDTGDDLSDDFQFTDKQTSELEGFGFLYQARLEGEQPHGSGYTLKTGIYRYDDDKKVQSAISIIFKPYSHKKYEKILLGETKALTEDNHWENVDPAVFWALDEEEQTEVAL